MKIALYSPAWPHGQNGIISYVRAIGAALRELGSEVYVLSFDANASLGFEVVVPLARNQREGLVARVLRKIGRQRDSQSPPEVSIARATAVLCEAGKIDLLEMEESFGWCGVVAERVPVPVVARLHGPYFLNGPYEEGQQAALDPVRLRMERQGLEKVAAVSAPSRQVLDATWSHYGLDRQASVIPNPVAICADEDAWSIERCDPDAILFVGRTDHRKGGDLVIRVFDELARHRKQLKLHFVGPDRGFADSRPGESIHQYLERLVPPDVRSRIIVHGPLPPTDIARLRRACRLTVAFSRYETFSIVCAEALAAGSPLVATPVGGVPEVVIHGETGLLCNPESIEDLASGVARLLDDNTLATQFGRAGRQMCIDRFHPSIVARRTLELYAATIAAGKR